VRVGWRWLAIGLAVLAAAVAGLAAGGGAPSASHAAERVRLERLGPTPARTLVNFSLVLQLRQARLHRFLAGLYDPHSALYHHFIDAQAFGRRFGVSNGRLAELRAALTRAGIRITDGYPQRTALDVVAPAGVVEHYFGVQLIDYRGSTGRRYHSPRGVPVIPRALRGVVSGVAGLHGALVPRTEDVPADGVSPPIAARAYDITPLYSQGIRGQGETVAVLESSGFGQSSLDDFSRQFGLPRFAPQDVPVPQDGPATDESNVGEEETELDLELIHEVAPQATILDYNAPNVSPSGDDTLGDMIDHLVAQGRVNIVSDSMGYCELGFPSADLQRDEQAIEAAVSHGINIFKSTGDSGAYQCERFDPSDHRLSVEWPASSPGVIAVGGTSLAVSASGGYSGEVAWQDVLEASGGGGGLSEVFARPPWQRAPGVSSRYSDGKRQIPDVSANADPNTGWALVTDGSLAPTAGTSAAAPFWAGAMALIEQYARQHGVRRLGFVDPMLYRIASTPQAAPPFHDITVGTNRYYPATPGWDFATGLGSPDVYNLAQDVVRYLKSRHG
jgi:subtilase family serine protease